MRIGRSLTSEFNHLVAFHHASSLLKFRKCWNIDQLAIAYAYRPRLRSRLTLGRLALPRKPWVYGGRGFHPSYRYSCLHPHFPTLHGQSPSRFNVLGMLLYRARSQDLTPRASVLRLSPIIFGAESLDESAITHCLNGGCF